MNTSLTHVNDARHAKRRSHCWLLNQSIKSQKNRSDHAFESRGKKEETRGVGARKSPAGRSIRARLKSRKRSGGNGASE